MIASLQCVVLDCPDDVALARFYHALLGGEVNRADSRWATGNGWSTLHLAGGLVLCFQKVAEHRPPRWPDPAHPQQLHLDLSVANLSSAHEQAISAGAIPLAAAAPERGWRTYADPAGHPFCLIPD